MVRRGVSSVFLLFVILGFSYPKLSLAQSEAEPEFNYKWSKQQKLITTNIVANTFIGVWGLSVWDYGVRDMHFTNESWFQANTLHGGADKIGHTYATFGLGHMFAWYFERWGYTQKEAAAYGALTSLGMHSFMEFGDSFSWFGFSYQDFSMNVLGAYLAYYLYQHPQRNRYLDLRVEYIPSGTTYDVFTDYQGLKYLAALKLEAFPWIRSPVLRYLELHTGYFVRGYEKVKEAKQRHVYVAVALNVGRMFRRQGVKRMDWFLRYFQVPFAYLPATVDLNGASRAPQLLHYQ
ncbi:MAG: YfiM family protein [Gammaproteobacteria bacterium]|nr:YfiM family protein [Gammaproteobacteria bacterium]